MGSAGSSAPARRCDPQSPSCCRKAANSASCCSLRPLPRARCFRSSTPRCWSRSSRCPMALTPARARAFRSALLTADEQEELDEDFEGAGADVLMVGFSRFGQIAAQILLAGGRASPSSIFPPTASARPPPSASASISATAPARTCWRGRHRPGEDRRRLPPRRSEITDKVVELVQSEFRDARLYVRSYDRIHSLELRNKGVDYELRETLESGLVLRTEDARSARHGSGQGFRNSARISASATKRGWYCRRSKACRADVTAGLRNRSRPNRSSSRHAN